MLHDLAVAWRNDAIKAEGGKPRDASKTSVIYKSRLKEGSGYHFLVFHDAKADAVILVELKRGRLESWHREQLGRYLDHAEESAMISGYLDAGSSLQGVLASVEPGKLKCRHKDITIRKLDAGKIMALGNHLGADKYIDGLIFQAF